MARYKWDSAHEWFYEWAEKRSDTYHLLTLLAEKVDGDTIQDLFQDDMEQSGFFRDLDKQVPALFVIDDNGEANGTVYLFCSDKCRKSFETDDKVDAGMSPVTIDAEECTECGNGL